MKIVVFSIDYDGCGDILFNEIKAKYPQHKETLQWLANSFLQCLKDIAASADHVILYVGSLRQSIEIDHRNCENNKNGLCFLNYEQLCRENKWEFNKLLLADVENKLLTGKAMQDEQYTCIPSTNKIDIVQNQFADISSNHATDEINFYFIDDDPNNEILNSLKNHFQIKNQTIPPNITPHFERFS